MHFHCVQGALEWARLLSIWHWPESRAIALNTDERGMALLMVIHASASPTYSQSVPQNAEIDVPRLTPKGWKHGS